MRLSRSGGPSVHTPARPPTKQSSNHNTDDPIGVNRMQKTLAQVTLKSGEAMKVIKTTAPEPAWTERIIPFLTHKGDLWLDPMRKAYDEGLDDLTMSDFLGVLESGEVVGNITTVEHIGVAILQHVFTPEQHRRKGICTAVLNALRDDFVARGGRAMSLGTGYDSAPYHIYETIGFRGRGDSGKMTWLADKSFHETHFAPGETTVRNTWWEDWPMLDALCALTGQWQLKGFHFQQIGHAGYERDYLLLRRGMEDGSVLDVKVMQKADGAVVGHAMLAVQSLWKGRVLVLDFMMHEDFYDQAGELLGAIAIPAGRKTQAFCDERARDKMTALEAQGFEREGVFREQIEDENHEALDVVVYGKIG